MLENLRNEYEKLCKQIKSTPRYEMVFCSNPSDDKDNNMIRWIINKKIPYLLEIIEWEEDKQKQDLYCNDCKASLKKVQKLLTDDYSKNY